MELTLIDEEFHSILDVTTYIYKNGAKMLQIINGITYVQKYKLSFPYFGCTYKIVNLITISITDG